MPKIESVKKQAVTLNDELIGKEAVDYNDLLSYLFRLGVIKGLSNKDLKSRRSVSIEKKLGKLYPAFTGFRVERNEENDTYDNVNFYNDIITIGEILALEYGIGIYKKNYKYLINAPFPLYFGWYPKSSIVYMKAEPTKCFSVSNIDWGNLVDSLSKEPLPGKPSEFHINETIDPELENTLILYFAEGAIPRKYNLSPIRPLVKQITDSIINKYNPPEQVDQPEPKEEKKTKSKTKKEVTAT